MCGLRVKLVVTAPREERVLAATHALQNLDTD